MPLIEKWTIEPERAHNWEIPTWIVCWLSNPVLLFSSFQQITFLPFGLFTQNVEKMRVGTLIKKRLYINSMEEKNVNLLLYFKWIAQFMKVPRNVMFWIKKNHLRLSQRNCLWTFFAWNHSIYSFAFFFTS